jgi:hypothetical protein
MLYNFHDSPADLYRRMQLNIELNEELNIRIFSFPMRYQPTNMKDRSFIGEKWNRYYLRSMQVILQATRGIVSGAPAFFRRAFGSTEQEFEDLLMRPHKFVFNRDWFEQLEGRDEFEEYLAALKTCTPADIADLKSLLVDFENFYFEAKRKTISNRKVARLWDYYRPLSDREEEDIWRRQRELQQGSTKRNCELPDDERVEDAGLDIEPVLN